MIFYIVMESLRAFGRLPDGIIRGYAAGCHVGSSKRSREVAYAHHTLVYMSM